MDIVTIQKRLSTIEKLEEENRVSNDMLKSELENDDEFQRVSETAKAAASKKKNLKDQILSQGSNKELVDKIKENTEEIKTNKEILTAELIDYARAHHVQELTDSHGNLRKFKFSVKLFGN